MGWYLAIAAIVALMIAAATPLVLTGVRNGIRGQRLFAVAVKAVLPGFMAGAVHDLLRHTGEMAARPARLDVDLRHRELLGDFNRELAHELHTVGGGFRGVGLYPWLFALFALAVAFSRGPDGAQYVPTAAGVLFLVVFPTLYRAGDSALDTLGIGQGMVYFGGIGWVIFAGVFQALVGTVVKVMLGTVWAPVHLLVFAVKGGRFVQRTADYLRFDLDQGPHTSPLPPSAGEGDFGAVVSLDRRR